MIRHTEQRGSIDRNGMRFVILPDDSAPLVEVAVRYDLAAEGESLVATVDRATLTAAFTGAGIAHPQLVEPPDSH